MINFDQYKKNHLNAIKSFNDIDILEKVIQKLITCLKKRLPVLIFGNGGSAADSLHFSAELIGKFLKEREALNIICLNANQSVLTALSNDYEFDSIFERQVEAHGQKDGMVIGISTSGKSSNILKGLKKAKSMEISTVMLTGKNVISSDLVNYCIKVKSSSTPLIQECHVMIYHYIAMRVEEEF